MMFLPSDGVEYATITLTGCPDGALVEVSLDRETWLPLDVPVAAQPDGTAVGRVLLRGPAAAGTTGLLVAEVSTPLWARVSSGNEVIPLRAGTITLA